MQNINQFSQGPEQGDLDPQSGVGSVLPCQVDVSSAGGLVAGQSVKMVDSAGGVPKIVECAADSDDIFGLIKRSLKQATFEVGDPVEVLQGRGGFMYVAASAAIARNAKVKVVIASKKVATATSGATVLGRALDKAAADGDLIRVSVDLPGDALP